MRQNLSKSSATTLVLVFAAALALAAVAASLWYMGGEPPGSLTQLRAAAEAPPNREVRPAMPADGSLAATFAPPETVVPPVPTLPTASASPPAASVPELVSQFRNSRSLEDKQDAARLIAGQGGAEGVNAIGQLFSQERDTRARLILISSLGDIPQDIAPDSRLQILTRALQKQPRDVRSAALDLLIEMDDKRALDLVRSAARSDPDQEIRDAAKALVSSRTESTAP